MLLLEAGPDFPDEEELTPLFVVSGGQHWLPAGIPELDWGYWNETLPNGHRVRLARGKLVGGSSMVNGCVAVRGAPFDFDRWAAFGNPGWGWEDVLPYFVELENDLDFGLGSAPRRLRADRRPPLRRASLGSRPPRVRGGVRRPRHVVRGRPQRAARVGRERRPVAAEPPARGTSRHARHLRAGCAQAAELRAAGGLPRRPRAPRRRCERPGSATSIPTGAAVDVAADLVVLAAGVYSTPPILQRSGIGPVADLRAAGIEPVHDLPVGRNLLDHPNCALGFHAPALAERVGRLFLTNCRGPIGMGGEPEWQAFPIPLDEVDGTAAIVVCLNRQEAEGSVLARSADPFEPPRIDHRYNSAEADFERFEHGFEFFREVTRTPRVQSLTAPAS